MCFFGGVMSFRKWISFFIVSASLLSTYNINSQEFSPSWEVPEWQPICPPPYYNLLGYSGGPYARYTCGKAIGIHDQYGTLGIMVSPKFVENSYRTFVDIKGHYIEDARWAANIGIGVRWWDDCQNASWGAYWYYDYRQIIHDENFDQVSFGFERLGRLLDLRINAYIPVERTIRTRTCADSSSSSSSSSSSGNSSSFYSFRGCHHCSSSSSSSDLSDCSCIEETESHSSVGFDLEAGVHLFNWKGIYFYSAVGGYYFTNHERENQTGARLRALLSIRDFLVIEGRVTQDRYENTNCQGVVTLTLPLDPAAWRFTNFLSPPQEDWIMTQPVVRNDMIVLNRRRSWKY